MVNLLELYKDLKIVKIREDVFSSLPYKFLDQISKEVLKSNFLLKGIHSGSFRFIDNLPKIVSLEELSNIELDGQENIIFLIELPSGVNLIYDVSYFKDRNDDGNKVICSRNLAYYEFDIFNESKLFKSIKIK